MRSLVLVVVSQTVYVQFEKRKKKKQLNLCTLFQKAKVHCFSCLESNDQDKLVHWNSPYEIGFWSRLFIFYRGGYRKL